MHMSTHTGEKEECGLCGQWLRCVAEHMRTVHKTGKQKPCTEVSCVFGRNKTINRCLRNLFTNSFFISQMYFSAAKFSSTLTTEESTQKGSMKGKSKFLSHFSENYCDPYTSLVSGQYVLSVETRSQN